jgi:predicted nucleic acid-binding protein
VAPPPLTADTSVVVPSLLHWHELHHQAAAALREVRRLPAHALIESFSVLTRLPGSRSLRPHLALQALVRGFPDEPFILSPGAYLRAIGRLAEAGLGGGQIYDAIVGATAAEAGACLLTADRRAVPTYALVGAQFRLLG